jgi:Type VI secretion system, TssC, VipB
MATQNTKADQSLQEKELQVKAGKPAEQLQQSLQQLEKFGAFDLLESAIDGVQNLSPERKARKDIFLNEQGKKAEREALLKTLEIWVSALSKEGDAADLMQVCQEKSEQASQLYKRNMKKALEDTRELERSYRSVALFFKNTESGKVKNVSFINAEMDQLKDPDNTRFREAIEQELVKSYDKLDLRKNYGLLIIPGYLGSNSAIEVWSKIAHKNKVMLVTDFADLDKPDDVMELFEEANLTGGDLYRSNVVMTCNWLIGRGKYSEVGESEDLAVPPAGALGGKIYYTLMSQVTAGKKHGSINEVDGVRFELKKSEIANLEKLGLVPMVNEFGKVMAFSAKTLFNGDNLGLQTYSVVRVFDYVCKVLMDFLNRRAFENFNASTRKEMLNQIVRFLDSITGPGKLIENFDIDKFEQDQHQKDRVHLDIRLKPYFPAKNFLIKLDGQKGDDGTDWGSKYEEKK